MIKLINVAMFSTKKNIEKMIIEELRCTIGNLLVPKIYCEKNKNMCNEFYVYNDGKCKNCKCSCPCECLNMRYIQIMNDVKK
jgi:hypothetical protein